MLRNPVVQHGKYCSVNGVNSVNNINSVNSVSSVNSVNSYSAVLPPSPMVFFISASHSFPDAGIMPKDPKTRVKVRQVEKFLAQI